MLALFAIVSRPAAVSFALGLTLGLPCATGSDLQRVDESVVDVQALVLGPTSKFGHAINGQSFQNAGLVTHAGWQYAAYYDRDRRVCLARRHIPDGGWHKLAFTDFRYPADNAHDTISLGISRGDGRIHLSFSQHGVPLRYRVSQPGLATDPASYEWKPGLFSPTTNRLGDHSVSSVTYPVFLPLPDGNLLFGWRQGASGNGENLLSHYDSATGTWSAPWPITSREGAFQDELGKSYARCAYFNDQEVTPDGRLHVTLCWREKAPTANHSLAYMVSEDGGRTWRNSLGAPLDGPARVDSPGLTVINIPRRLGLLNQCGQTVDSAGRVHVLMVQCTDSTLAESPQQPPWGHPTARRYVHSWRGTDGQWQQTVLPGAVGTRPKIIADSDGNLFGIALAPTKATTFSNGLYPNVGQLVIYHATAKNRWTDWNIVHREPRPFLTEPIIDVARWRDEAILSILVQEAGENFSPIRVLTFRPEPT